MITNSDRMELLFKEYSYAIIGACMEVHKYLGPGFLEVVYKDAIEIELMRTGIYFEREKKYEVMYKGNKYSIFMWLILLWREW